MRLFLLPVLLFSLITGFNKNAESSNWNSSSNNSPFLKFIQSQSNLEKTVAGCWSVYSEHVLIETFGMASEIMAGKNDLVEVSKKMTSRLLDEHLMMSYLVLDMKRFGTDEGRELMAIADQAKGLFDPNNKVDGGEKVGAICAKAASAFQLKYPAETDDARSAALDKMNENKKKLIAQEEICKKQFPVKYGNKKNVTEHLGCLFSATQE